MSKKSLNAISPIDGRYSSKTENLSNFFSEKALIRYRVLVEIEYFISLTEVEIPGLSNWKSSDNKLIKNIYEKFSDDVKGFLAQGSEDGFGKKYARGINDAALNPKDQFIQIVSCNTHNMACITKTLALNDNPDNLIEGNYVCIRRANDISQPENF